MSAQRRKGKEIEKGKRNKENKKLKIRDVYL